jgi:two-component system, chemotaxis family, chemotaxis protein CheY
MSGYQFDRLRALVVDDNPHMRTLVSRLLTAFGVKHVYEAGTAEEAWSVLLDTPCDVAFIDWVMPGASGLEFTERVRTAGDSPNPFLPIIILTGHTSLDHVSKARDAGVNEFLAKPVSAQAILSRLIAVVDHPRPFVRSHSYFGPCRRRHRDGGYHGPERRVSEPNAAAETPQAADAA